MPHCSDAWQCRDRCLAMLPQAPYCRQRSSPYWLSDQCDLESSFSIPTEIKHVMLVACNASEERRGAIAFCLLQANPIMEMRNQMAVCLQVCMCTHVHTDSFKDMYPRLALLAGLGETWKGLAMIAMIVSSELESI